MDAGHEDMEDSFNEMLASEEECRSVLYRYKWPNGFYCPVCKHDRYYTILSRLHPLYECKSCGHQASLTAGTIMHGSRTSISHWFLAIKLMTAGISAKALAALLGVTYKTAWLLNHKLRYAMKASHTDHKLMGFIRVTGAFYGGSDYHSSVFLSDQDQPVLAGASIQSDGSLTQIKLQQTPRELLKYRYWERSTIELFAQTHIDVPRSQIIVTEYNGKQSHRPLSHVLKGVFRWLSTTFSGIAPKHLQAYLEEYSYRINLYLRHIHLLPHLACLCSRYMTLTYPQLIKRTTMEAKISQAA